jgi:uncharacterized protein
MQINVAQLLKEPTGSSRTYNIEGLPASNGVEAVHGTITLIRIDKGILTQGVITAKVKGECNRCLEPAERPVELHIEEEFLPSLDIITNTKMKYKSDTPTIDNNHILDLNGIISQYIILATPMKFVCKDSCAGICPSCGKNLNAGHCGCNLHGHLDNSKS